MKKQNKNYKIHHDTINYALEKKQNFDIIKLLLKYNPDFQKKNEYIIINLIIALKNNHSETLIKYLINNIEDINNFNKNFSEPILSKFSKNYYLNYPIVNIALENKYNLSIIKLFIYKNTQIDEKTLIYLCDNYSIEDIKNFFILFNFSPKNILYILKSTFDLSKLTLALKGSIIIEEKKDSFGWNIFNYLIWKNKMRRIDYLLIYNYK